MSATNTEIKEYVLMDHMNLTTNIFVQISEDERVKLNRLKVWRPYLQAVIFDESGESRTIRLKLGAKSIYQDDQIAQGIPANEKMTEAERNAVTFRNGILRTDKKIVQDFLETHPQFDGFKGSSPEGLSASFKVFERNAETKNTNKAVKESIKAASIVAETNLEQVQELLIRVFGLSYALTDDLEDQQNILFNEIDANEDAVAEILAFGKEQAQEEAEREVSVDTANKVLVGQLLNKGLLSFSAKEGMVSKLHNKQWSDLKSVSAEFDSEQQHQQFLVFLGTKDGEAMLAELKKMNEKIIKTPVNA
jgi:hypothetical protein